MSTMMEKTKSSFDDEIMITNYGDKQQPQSTRLKHKEGLFMERLRPNNILESQIFDSQA